MILLDDLVGEQEDRSWDGQAELAGGLQVDDEVELDRLLDRQVAGLGALQDAVDIVGGAGKVVRHIGSVRYQAALIGVFPLRVDGGQARRIDQRDDVPA